MSLSTEFRLAVQPVSGPQPPSIFLFFFVVGVGDLKLAELCRTAAYQEKAEVEDDTEEEDADEEEGTPRRSRTTVRRRTTTS